MITLKINTATTQNYYLPTGTLMYEIKTEDIYKDFSSDKEIFDFSNYLIKAKYYNDWNKLVIGKMKDETTGVAIEEFFRLKPKMDYFLINDNSESKKRKGRE